MNSITFIVAVIACKPNFPPYLNALLPKDQVFEFEEEEQCRSPQRRKGGKENGKEEEEEEAVKNENDAIDNPYLRPVKLPPNRNIKTIPVTPGAIPLL